MTEWRCRVCGYTYDTADEGKDFPDLPEDWRCPVCMADKGAFEKQAGEAEIHDTAVTTVSDVIMQEMADWGIEIIFGIPGTSSLGLVEALRKNPKLRYVVVRHEENAAMAASAYNKLTGKLAACLTIAGPGATNLATGLCDAREDGASVLALCGQVRGQYRGPGGVQEIDQDAFFRPFTVYNNSVSSREMAVPILTRALKYALIRHGPVEISVPNNIQKEPLERTFSGQESCIAKQSVMPPDDEIRAAAARIRAAERPVILAGKGAMAAADEVVSLAETLQAPLLSTFGAKGIVPEENPWFVSILGNVGSPEARRMAEEADLLITLGVGFSKFTNVPKGVPLIQVDMDPLRLGRGRPESSLLWGDCAGVIPKLRSLLEEGSDEQRVSEIRSAKTEWKEKRKAEADASKRPLRPPYIMDILSDLIPEDAVISIDVGENGWWFGRNFRMKRQRFVMSGYFASMGFGLPGALAAKLAYPEKAVFCITGDGGFSMAMADFVTAVKYDLPMVVILLNNHALGMIRVEQMTEHYPNFGTDLRNPDFAAFADACGGLGLAVSEPGELREAIKKAMSSGKPAMVDVETDPVRF